MKNLLKLSEFMLTVLLTFLLMIVVFNLIFGAISFALTENVFEFKEVATLFGSVASILTLVIMSED